VVIANAVGAGHEARGAASVRTLGVADMADSGLGPAAEDASTSRAGAAGVIFRGAVVSRDAQARAAIVS
jgi:hypothetical protein